MTLEVMPTLVNHLCRDKKENSSSKAEIRHRGKSGRESLLGICQQKSPYLYQLPKEFSVCVDSVGHWYLVASHPLTDEAQFNAKAEERKAGRTDLDGPIKVLSGDPGARTFLALYSSDGQTIGIVFLSQVTQTNQAASRAPTKATRPPPAQFDTATISA
ncbi:hypothetical protein [Sporisorium scitamineum]|uniref:Uncharacterized protein n=1 Tax=Sporisorium scitamineum TaxID=49012 RepID=A0A0F7RVK8_9BASI|nr:hypothetical protein [Sporisorium scitamineum]